MLNCINHSHLLHHPLLHVPLAKYKKKKKKLRGTKTLKGRDKINKETLNESYQNLEISGISIPNALRRCVSPIKHSVIQNVHLWPQLSTKKFNMKLFSLFFFFFCLLSLSQQINVSCACARARAYHKESFLCNKLSSKFSAAAFAMVTDVFELSLFCCCCCCAL